MSKKILIINGHPRAGSFSDAMADSYLAGAKKAGHEAELILVRQLNFSLHLEGGYGGSALEPDLIEIQSKIKQADHLVIATPVWWMGVPALLKGFFDRVLTPGFAYKYEKRLLPFPRPLLKGKSARVLYTQGSARWVTTLFCLDAFWIVMKFATLLFCGISPARRLAFYHIVKSDDQKRQNFLGRVRKLGEKGI